MRTINWRDLPDDMQVLIGESTPEEYWTKLDRHAFRILSIPVADFPQVRLGVRDREYSREMIGHDLPPVLIYGDALLDGRHRIWAARAAGQKYIDAIDLAEALTLDEAIPGIGLPSMGRIKRQSRGTGDDYRRAFLKWYHNPGYKDTEEHIAFNPDAPDVDGYEGMIVQYKPGTRLPGASRRIGGAGDVYDFARNIGMLDDMRERVYAIYLNQKNKPMGYRLIGAGSPSQSMADQRVIFGPAVALQASALIVLHNHPAGSLEPSFDDQRLTEALKKNAEQLNFRLLDHVIVSRDGYYGIMSEQRGP